MPSCICCALVCMGMLLFAIAIGWLMYKYATSLSFKRLVSDFVFPMGGMLFIWLVAYVIGKTVLSVDDGDILRAWSAIGAVLLGLIVYRAQRRLLIYQIVERVSGELSEIYRHLGANLEVLEKIDSSKGVPSLLHIRKLEITKYSSLSDESTLKNLDKRHNKIVFPMTVRVRNYNINVDAIVEYLKSSDKKEETFKDYMAGIVYATKDLRIKIEECLEEMDVKMALQRSNPPYTKSIIYDASWKRDKASSDLLHIKVWLDK